MSPSFFSGNIANMIPEGPLNKMVPLTEDRGGGVVVGWWWWWWWWTGTPVSSWITRPVQRVADIVSRGVTLTKTGDSWSRVTHTENDTSANPQSTPKQTQFNKTLDYLRNSEGKLITSGENMSFPGSRSHQNYCDNEAPQMIDFVKHGGPRRDMSVFDGTGDIDVFFKNFESVVRACEWPEYETVSQHSPSSRGSGLRDSEGTET